MARRLCHALIETPGGDPADLDALARLCAESGDLGLAEALLHKACDLAPGHPQFRSNLAYVLFQQRRPAEACEMLAATLQDDPLNTRLQEQYGILLSQLWRFEEAAEIFRRLLVTQPSAVAWTNLGYCLNHLQRKEDAERAYRNALAIRSDDPVAWSNLGNLLASRRQMAEAEQCLRQALSVRPGYADAYNSLGNLFKEQGRLDEALEAYQACLNLQPGNHVARSNRLLCLNYCFNDSPDAFFSEHLAWEAHHARPWRAEWRAHANSPDPERPLAIGFVSSDLRQHAVARFFLPFVEHHDAARYRVICYSCVAHPDAVSEQIKRASDAWIDCGPFPDPLLAERIRADRIDILIDLAGHTSGNRLRVFARRPAPVQATWLGYLNTTGLSAIDYRIVDAVTSPPGCDVFNSERLARLPHSPWCYSPPAEARPVGALPMLSCGYPTFISANSFQKINASVLDLWAQLLAKQPDARLLMLGVPPEAAVAVMAAMRRHRVDEARVSLRARLELADYFAAFAEADVALDPFPYSGGTTTCDALWMGVPVITLGGRQEPSRSAASVLSTLGISHCIAGDEAEYLALACRQIADPPALAATRAGLRSAMQASPAADAVAFSRSFEALLRGMWRTWCTGTRPEDAPA